MTVLPAISRDRRTDVGFAAGVAVIGIAAGLVGTSHPKLALGLVLSAAAVGVLALRPVLLAVAAVPAVYGYQSVGFGDSIGISDVLIVAGALVAVPALVRGPTLKRVSPLNRGFALYLLLLMPALLAHPSAAAGREIVHRLIIVAAATVMGAWIAHEGQVRLALRLLIATSSFFAAAACLTWLRNGHHAAYPLGYHKNYVGSLLALTLLVLLCAPSHLALRSRLRLPVAALLITGMLACESRGAILTVALGALLWLFAPRQGTGVRGGTRVVAAVMAIGFAVFAGTSIEHQLTAGNVTTNSVGVRRSVEAYTRELWRTSPLDGVGIRYFTSGQYGELAQAPNNAIDSELAEGGLLGTTGFVAFHLIVLALLWRCRRSALGLAALAMVSGQLLHGMVDIYWSSGITPLPFMVAGMALASSKVGAHRMRQT